ncbi:MAG: sugar ABC transporter permease [Firmicutes bacterium]|nr:sugar ABC transporter permease [Bacillota bacterium]
MKRNALRKRETLMGYVFLAPTLIGFILFMAFPFVASLILAFSKWNMMSGLQGIQFIGLENFSKMFVSRNFGTAIKNNLLISATTVPVTLLISLVIAYLLNEVVYMKKTIRVIYFVPYICNIVATSIVWKLLFRTDGPINSILYSLGVSEVPRWLASTQYAMIPILALTVWMGIGYDMVIYMAALQNIPTDLYEAGELDGAIGIRRFIHITIPMLSPTTYFLVVTRMIMSFQIFSSINIITQGALKTTVLVYEVYKEAFISYKFGYGSAIAWILFLIILAITLIQMWTEKKWVTYV